IRQIEADSDRLRTELDRVTAERDSMYLGWPPGHFYSPIPSIEQIRAKEAAIFRIPSQIPAINLNVEGQLALFDAIKQYYAEQPFADHKQEGVRYFFVNPNFSYGEAIVLYSLIRFLKPRKIIEIGSGYSSCAILDTNELFFDGSIDCT